MIGTKTVRVTAGHPDLPMERVCVVQGSALSVGVIDVPRTRFGVKITGIAVSIENAGGVVASVAAKAEGNVWTATFPATHFAAAGVVANGVTITASGTDENSAARAWVIGAGDLEVVSAESTPEPGEVVERITTKTFDGETVPLETEDDMYNGLKKILVKLGATVACLAACLAASALPPPGYTNNTYSADGVTWTRHGALNTRTAYVVTDTSAGGGGGGAPNYGAVSNAAMSAVQTVNCVSGTNITIDAAAVGARPSTWTPSASDVGAATPGDATNAAAAVVIRDVPAWARETNKPTYTAEEVNALPVYYDETSIQMTNGKLTITSYDTTMSGTAVVASERHMFVNGIGYDRGLGWYLPYDTEDTAYTNSIATRAWTEAQFTSSNDVESIVASHPRLVALTGYMTNEVETANLDGVRLPTIAFATNYANAAALYSFSSGVTLAPNTTTMLNCSPAVTNTIVLPSTGKSVDMMLYVRASGATAITVAPTDAQGRVNAVRAVKDKTPLSITEGEQIVTFTLMGVENNTNFWFCSNTEVQ